MFSFVADCQPGEMSYGRLCTKCPRGTYQPDSRMTACIACPLNFTTRDVGSANIADCKCNQWLHDYSYEELYYDPASVCMCVGGRERGRKMDDAASVAAAATATALQFLCCRWRCSCSCFYCRLAVGCSKHYNYHRGLFRWFCTASSIRGRVRSLLQKEAPPWQVDLSFLCFICSKAWNKHTRCTELQRK